MTPDWQLLSREQLLEEIKRGGRLVHYSYCVSILILTFKRSTSPQLIRAGQSPALMGLPWTALTLVAGWWGIPWGPIYTIQCVARNLRGGYDVTDRVVEMVL
jgi:hypothetical protein